MNYKIFSPEIGILEKVNRSNAEDMFHFKGLDGDLPAFYIYYNKIGIEAGFLHISEIGIVPIRQQKYSY